MLLIHPPIAKASEPPAGIARLCGCLKHHGVKCHLLDANLESILHLIRSDKRVPQDTWTNRAFKNRELNLSAVRSWRIYGKIDPYRRTVLDLNRALEKSSGSLRVVPSLADYRDLDLSPVRSSDLFKAAEEHEKNVFYPYFLERIPEMLDQTGARRIGISINYLSQALASFALAGFLRKRFPSVEIILGGSLITSWSSNSHRVNPFRGLADHVVAGDGEDKLLSILKIPDPIGFYEPDYNQLPLHEYLAPGMILPFSSSSGCPWNRCLFCPQRAEGNHYRPLPIRAVSSQLKSLIGETRPIILHLLDNAVSPALMNNFINDPPGVPWYGFTRITKELMDPQFCRALRRSGCVMLKLGIESGDQEVVDRMEKGIDLTVASKSLKTLKQSGIGSYVYLLFGTQFEGIESARKTLSFTEEHADSIDFLNIAIFNMPARLESGIERKDFYTGDLCLYRDFSHPQGWGRRKVRSFLDKEFRKSPRISAVLRRTPPLFTSNHAPLFLCASDNRKQALEWSERQV